MKGNGFRNVLMMLRIDNGDFPADSLVLTFLSISP